MKQDPIRLYERMGHTNLLAGRGESSDHTIHLSSTETILTFEDHKDPTLNRCGLIELAIHPVIKVQLSVLARLESVRTYSIVRCRVPIRTRVIH